MVEKKVGNKNKIEKKKKKVGNIKNLEVHLG